jgi:hypothetical protein
VDELIRQAIAERRLIAYRYNGQRRVGEPHLYGIWNGQPTVLVYQTEGTTFSGPYPNWRRLSLSGLTRFVVTGRPFQHARLKSGETLSGWSEVWAVVR